MRVMDDEVEPRRSPIRSAVKLGLFAALVVPALSGTVRSVHAAETPVASSSPAVAFDELFESAGEQLRQAGPRLEAVRRQVIEDLEAFAQTHPRTPQAALALQNAGSLAEALGEDMAAADFYREALKHGPPRDVHSEIAYKLADLFAKPGNPVMDFEVRTLEGETLSRESLKGSVYLLDFWATWCGPCIGELPHLRETYAMFRDQGFRVVSVSIDEDQDVLKAFLRKNDMPWTHVWDDDPDQPEQLADKFAVWGIPHTILVDAEGTIIGADYRGHALKAAVGKAIGE